MPFLIFSNWLLNYSNGSLQWLLNYYFYHHDCHIAHIYNSLYIRERTFKINDRIKSPNTPESRAEFTCLTYGSVNFHDQLYGWLESYGSVSTYRRLETYGCVNFHDLIFFGSKCLKLPNSSRKVVKLRSKNF